MQHASTLQLEVVDSERVIWTGRVEHLVTSATEGEIGIYPNHIPLITTLKPGMLRLKLANQDEQIVFALSGGFLEIRDNHATILADIAVRSDELDEQRLIDAKHQAQIAITQTDNSNKAHLNLEIILAQLKTVEYIKRIKR